MALPAGVLVSMPCWWRYKSTPLACSSARNPTRSCSDRPRRSTDHAATWSKSRPGDALAKLVEAWALVAALGAANAFILEDRHDVPAVPLGDGLQFPSLVLD